jgi:hypothetical protein
MRHKKIGPVDTGVGQKINGNQIQDGAPIFSGHSGLTNIYGKPQKTNFC